MFGRGQLLNGRVPERLQWKWHVRHIDGQMHLLSGLWRASLRHAAVRRSRVCSSLPPSAAAATRLQLLHYASKLQFRS
jgi:hypothetical protein